MRHLFIPALALFAFIGCDETVNVDNQPPEVTVQAYCRADDEVRFILTVQDHERDPVNVELQTTHGRIPSAATGHGLVGLSSDKDHGVTHVVVWGSDCALVADALGSVSACNALDKDAPSTLELTVLAGDDEDLATPAAFTLELADECP